MDKGFNVFDLAESYATDNGLSGVEDLFKSTAKFDNTITKDETIDKKVEDDEIKVVHDQKEEDQSEIKPKRWTPDESLTKDMKELSYTPISYTRDQLIEEDKELKNGADEENIENARRSMDEMSRKLANIEEAKHRHGIKNFKIPAGEIQTKILIAASDPQYRVAQHKLDELFNMIKTSYPNFIYEWEDDYKEIALKKEMDRIKNSNPDVVKGDTVINVEDVAKQNLGFDKEFTETVGTDPAMDIKIIIDKRNLNQISWDKDEISKIKKSRTIELNIIETKNIEFSQIEDVPENMVDVVLQPYNRKTNDITASLPASKYRCTFTGLSYPEVLDLSNSTEMDNIDGERKKWSICFNHIKNQSIGPWEEYQWYIDPKTNKEVRIGFTDPNPEGITDDMLHVVSKFEDFLKKTSHTDLDFMLWKIICATTMDEEIITVDCNALLSNGESCGKSYDWVYRPADLLVVESINPSILEDMEKTAKVSSKEEILENYNSSLVRSENAIKLNSSGLIVIFGHVSAYDYLNDIYSGIEALQSEEDLSGIISKGFNYILLTTVKSILVPQENGKYKRISGIRNLANVLNRLDEVDWLTLKKLTEMTVDPYEFKFMMRDLVCPHCKNKSNIPIDNMLKLLFIITQSLASVEVTFKKI